ncbi:MAG: glyoxalase, partial [Chitinophagaceae bacterium]
TRLDPILAVNDIEASAEWYQSIFGFKKAHGGDDFAVLTTEENEIILCLHEWGEHNHPSLFDKTKPSGNGLLLYFSTTEFESVKNRVDKAGAIITENVHLNQRSLRNEFSFLDLDGYHLTVTEFHEYK